MNNVSIVEELNGEHITQLHELFKQMWWTRERTKNDIETMLRNCMSFGVIDNDSRQLVGYARVLTDEIKYAFIFDVMTDERYRGKGLSRLIMETIINHPRLKNVKNFELTCAPDMVGFYEKFNFSKDYGDVVPIRLCKLHI